MIALLTSQCVDNLRIVSLISFFFNSWYQTQYAAATQMGAVYAEMFALSSHSFGIISKALDQKLSSQNKKNVE